MLLVLAGSEQLEIFNFRKQFLIRFPSLLQDDSSNRETKQLRVEVDELKLELHSFSGKLTGIQVLLEKLVNDKNDESMKMPSVRLNDLDVMDNELVALYEGSSVLIDKRAKTLARGAARTELDGHKHVKLFEKSFVAACSVQDVYRKTRSGHSHPNQANQQRKVKFSERIIEELIHWSEREFGVPACSQQLKVMRKFASDKLCNLNAYLYHLKSLDENQIPAKVMKKMAKGDQLLKELGDFKERKALFTELDKLIDEPENGEVQEKSAQNEGDPNQEKLNNDEHGSHQSDQETDSEETDSDETDCQKTN